MCVQHFIYGFEFAGRGNSKFCVGGMFPRFFFFLCQRLSGGILGILVVNSKRSILKDSVLLWLRSEGGGGGGGGRMAYYFLCTLHYIPGNFWLTEVASALCYN